MTNILPFPARPRAEKSRHPFTNPMLIAAIEAGYAAPLCRCERAAALLPECENRALRLSRDPACLGGICQERD